MSSAERPAAGVGSKAKQVGLLTELDTQRGVAAGIDESPIVRDLSAVTFLAFFNCERLVLEHQSIFARIKHLNDEVTDSLTRFQRRELKRTDSAVGIGPAAAHAERGVVSSKVRRSSHRRSKAKGHLPAQT